MGGAKVTALTETAVVAAGSTVQTSRWMASPRVSAHQQRRLLRWNSRVHHRDYSRYALFKFSEPISDVFDCGFRSVMGVG